MLKKIIIIVIIFKEQIEFTIINFLKYLIFVRIRALIASI